MPTAAVTNRFVVAAPASIVWETLVDTARYAEWNPRLTRVDGAFSAGAVVALSYVGGRLLPPTHFVVDVCTFVPGRALAWRGPRHVGRALVRAVHGFSLESSADGASTTVVHEEAFDGALVPLVWPLLSRVVAQNHAAVNAALTARAESLARSTRVPAR